MNQYDYTEEYKKQVVSDYFSCGSSQIKFAVENGIDRSTLSRWIKLYRHEIEYGIKDDQKLKAVSTYTPVRDEEGVLLSATWTKVDIKHEEAVTKLEALAQGLIENIQPVPPKEYKGQSQESLCSNYIISDFHLGQYSSLKELGESWSLDEGFETICGWIKAAIAASPKSKQAVLCDLGDFLHADGLMPVTPASKHVLDADGRFFDVVDVAIAAFDFMINELLEHHENVHIIICEGNHNEASSHWMTRLIARKYENEPRLTFDKNDLPYYAFQWGKTGLFYHHGHKKRIAQIAETIIAMFRKIYGKTKYHYIHTGHLHHRHVKESALAVVEQHSTIAAKDAHSARGGYSSERGASVITYHDKFGEVARATIRPEMLI